MKTDTIKTVSPMVAVYRTAVPQLPPGSLLLIRLGDFWEAFDDHAKRLAVALNITLTKRNDVPMAGIPFHALATYVATLSGNGIQVFGWDRSAMTAPELL